METRLQTGELYKRKSAAASWEPQWVMDIVVALLTCVHEALLPHMDRSWHTVADKRPRSATRDGRAHWIQQTSAWALTKFKDEFNTLDTSDPWERQELHWDDVNKATGLLRLFVNEAGKGASGRWHWAPLEMEAGEVDTAVEDASAALLAALMGRTSGRAWSDIYRDGLL
ncbi:MAG: hypothetical protein GY772_15505 [bacterium]|nr:hypothetical protein [bacterium]